MIDPNATALRAQAIAIYLTGSGWWCVFDASGALHDRFNTRDEAIECARVRFHVRPDEWKTTQVRCDCGDNDDCRKCGGHGFHACKPTAITA